MTSPHEQHWITASPTLEEWSNEGDPLGWLHDRSLGLSPEELALQAKIIQWADQIRNESLELKDLPLEQRTLVQKYLRTSSVF